MLHTTYLDIELLSPVALPKRSSSLDDSGSRLTLPGATLLGKVHEVFETRRQLDWQTLSFAPITTDVIELEVFDASPGERFPSYAVSELEVLVCE